MDYIYNRVPGPSSEFVTGDRTSEHSKKRKLEDVAVPITEDQETLLTEVPPEDDSEYSTTDIEGKTPIRDDISDILDEKDGEGIIEGEAVTSDGDEEEEGELT